MCRKFLSNSVYVFSTQKIYFQIQSEFSELLPKTVPFPMENKFSNLIQTVRSDLESKNKRITSDIKKLKLDLESRLDLVLESVPDPGPDMSALEHSSRRTSQMLETKLSKLYLDLVINSRSSQLC